MDFMMANHAETCDRWRGCLHGGTMSVRTVGDVFHSIALLPKRETACGQDSVKKMLAARRRLRYSNSCAETRT